MLHHFNKTKAFSICVLVIVGTTFNALSQNSEMPQGLNLPANSVELVDSNGRKLTADVLGKTPTQLKIRTQDGNEHLVPFTRLSDETYRMIFGVDRPEPQVQERDIRTNFRDPKTGEVLRPSQAAWRLSDEMTPKSHQTWKTIAHCNATDNGEEKIPIQEIHQMYLNRDPRIVPNMNAIQLQWEEDQRSFYRNLPPGVLVNPLDIILKLEVKPREEDEKVSLKEKFQQMNLNLPRQGPSPNCMVYTSHNIYQYTIRNIGVTAPNLIENFRRGTEATHKLFHYEFAEKAIMVNRQLGINQRMRFLRMNMRSPIQPEVAKHLLRNGIPIDGGIEQQGGGHSVMIIGFETKNGQTKWEYFDPHIKFGESIVVQFDYAIWFE